MIAEQLTGLADVGAEAVLDIVTMQAFPLISRLHHAHIACFSVSPATPSAAGSSHGRISVWQTHPLSPALHCSAAVASEKCTRAYPFDLPLALSSVKCTADTGPNSAQAASSSASVVHHCRLPTKTTELALAPLLPSRCIGSATGGGGLLGCCRVACGCCGLAGCCCCGWCAS